MAQPPVVSTRLVKWKLWIAQGFGIGRIPVAPGTFGSILGVAFFAVLLCGHSVTVIIAGVIICSALSVWLCGEAEKILGQTDPGSVVLDEIAAMPLCFLGSTILIGAKPELYFRDGWPFTAAVFVAFRIFDVWKPWPVKQSQRLPGGWGVTVDDLLAAVYVNVLAIAFLWWYSQHR
jgi:phosphatidylglycerophosphatase A